MSTTQKTIDVRVERLLATTPAAAYDAWLDPKVPGTPWAMSDKLLLTPKVDGFFYWFVHQIAHYGRFTEMARPSRLQHTWVSPNTHGLESVVTVTFEADPKGTRMTLVHTGLPDSDLGRSHEKGWNFFLDGFRDQLAKTE